MISAGRAHRFFIAAAVAGIAHALPSLYWALGGTALVSTLGEWAARWQRESPGEVAVLLSLIFLAKLAGAMLPLVNERGLLPAPRLWRGLFWCAAALLVTYGASNVVAALAALTGMIGTAQTMDTTALVGHAFLWDPLFLLWGLLLAAALMTSRPRRVSAGADPRWPKAGDLQETEHPAGARTQGRSRGVGHS
ncbi:MAG: DUF3995 domain-containing protein [Actinomycetota bacterium]|nr:DUF3995 domain-containing protein [Actinomycetota bacterium]